MFLFNNLSLINSNLFLMFYLEIFYLVPLTISSNKISYYGFSILLVFYISLILGFVYEFGLKLLDFTNKY